MTEQHLIALVNAIACAISWFIMVCRLNSMRHMPKGRFWVRAEYAVGVGAMIASAFRPLINEWPGYASLCVAAYVLVALIASGKAWRGDKPPANATAPAPLGVR